MNWLVLLDGIEHHKYILEKDYGPFIDVWAIGCIFVEALGVMKENSPTFLDKKPFFPGILFPLTSDNHNIIKEGFPFSSTD